MYIRISTYVEVDMYITHIMGERATMSINNAIYYICNPRRATQYRYILYGNGIIQPLQAICIVQYCPIWSINDRT